MCSFTADGEERQHLVEIWAQLEAARGEAKEQKCQLATAQVSSSFRRRRGVLGLEESGTITELLSFSL